MEQTLMLPQPDGSVAEKVFYSTSGTPVTDSQFLLAADEYQVTGKARGFTVYNEGEPSLKRMRDFQALVGKPARDIAKIIAKGLTAPTSEMATTQQPGLLPTTATGKGQKEAERDISSFISSPVATPEAAGATAGLVASQAMTAGATGVAPLLLRGLAAGVGHQLMGDAVRAKKAEKAYKVTKDAIITAGLSMGGEGAFKFFQNLIGVGLSQTAKTNASKKLMEVVRDYYPDLVRSGDKGFRAIWNTPQGVQRFSAAGVGVLRENIDDATTSIITSINSAAPRTIRKGTRTKILKHTDDYIGNLRKYIDEPNGELATEYLAIANKSREDILTLIAKDFEKLTEDQGQRLLKVFDDFRNRQLSVHEAAEVIGALRRSGSVNGLNVQEFQRELHESLVKNKSNSAILIKAAEAVGVGVDDVSNIIKSLKPMNQTLGRIPWLQKHLPTIAHKVPRLLRQGYQSPLPAGIAAKDIPREIREFVREKRTFKEAERFRK